MNEPELPGSAAPHITSDIPPFTPEPNPVRDAWIAERQKETELAKKNPMYEVSTENLPSML